MSAPLSRRTWLHGALSGAAALALGGCATPPRPHEERPESYWAGRLSLQIDSEPPQRLSGAFELLGDADSGELRLMTPLGQTVATASWTPAQAMLRRGDDTRLYPDTDTLTTELTGTALPLPALFAWLRGQSASVPGWTADLSRHAEGRLSAQRLHPLPAVQLRLVLQ